MAFLLVSFSLLTFRIDNYTEVIESVKTLSLTIRKFFFCSLNTMSLHARMSLFKLNKSVQMPELSVTIKRNTYHCLDSLASSLAFLCHVNLGRSRRLSDSVRYCQIWYSHQLNHFRPKPQYLSRIGVVACKWTNIKNETN